MGRINLEDVAITQQTSCEGKIGVYLEIVMIMAAQKCFMPFASNNSFFLLVTIVLFCAHFQS